MTVELIKPKKDLFSFGCNSCSSTDTASKSVKSFRIQAGPDNRKTTLKLCMRCLLSLRQQMKEVVR